MAAPTETEHAKSADEATADQESRLKRYDQRLEEWLTSLKEGAEQRSPEVLGALATKAKDVGDYLDKLADKARARNEPSAPVETSRGVSAAEVGQGAHTYGGPDPESDPKGDGDHEDQGT